MAGDFFKEIHFIFIIILLYLLVTYTKPSECLCDDDSNKFDVVIPSNEQVGLLLGRYKEVRSIVNAEHSWIYLNGGVRIGDTLLSVNGEDVNGLAIRDIPDAINNATLPKVLTFLPFDCEARHVAHMYTPMNFEEHLNDNVPRAHPHMDLSVGPESLGTLPVVNSQFGTDATCRSFKIAIANPKDACQPLENKVKGMYVLVNRGHCSFSVKAEMVQGGDGAGMILVNSKHSGPEFPMQLDQAHQPGQITIPAVMISKESAREIKVLMKHHKYHGGVKGRLVTTLQCYRGDKLWHSEHVTPDQIIEDEETKQKAGRKDPQRIHRAKGQVPQIKIMVEEDEDIHKEYVTEKPESELSLTEKAKILRESQGVQGGFIKFSNDETQFKYEFLSTAIGGPLTLDQPLTVSVVSPEQSCEDLRLLSQMSNSMVVVGPFLPHQSKCDLMLSLSILEEREAAGVIIVADSLLTPIQFDENSIDGFDDDAKLTLAIVITSKNEGEEFTAVLKGKMATQQPTILIQLEENSDVYRQWKSLVEVSDPVQWPAGPKKKMIYNKLKQRHDPSTSATGSVFRLETLQVLYESSIDPNSKTTHHEL
mmetsp:Transcript_24738/g.32304  ORF Transcript_24738/g.32304 Transcript_24738/m.32304 type:complete len:591 (-) Transcript_24738:267-2039(-)